MGEWSVCGAQHGLFGLEGWEGWKGAAEGVRWLVAELIRLSSTWYPIRSPNDYWFQKQLRDIII